jgi:tRNA modification GTPase
LRDLISEKSILAVNKSDLGIENMFYEFKKYNPIYISLKNEKNLDQLIAAIKKKLKNQFIISDDILITRERHRQHLEQCVSNLEKFKNKNESEDFDKAAEDLRLATRHLGMIVGKVDVEEVLGSIFNDFCIGK